MRANRMLASPGTARTEEQAMANTVDGGEGTGTGWLSPHSVEGTHIVTPAGAAPEGTAADEDAFEDAHDVDELGALEDTSGGGGHGGPRAADEAAFEDNSAEWSRTRP
ncbi:MAG: hypothetical protein NVSMB29_04930 [Candidatus Dormibacteria bacterium]